MGMPLVGFEANAGIEGDRLKASDILDKPLLVYVVDRVENMITEHAPAPGKPAIHVDIFEMLSQDKFLHVMWMNPAVVDQLTKHIGQAVPIKLVNRTPKTGGKPYITVEALDEANYNVAVQWVNAQPNMFEDARKERDIPTAAEIQARANGLAPRAESAPAAAPVAATPPAAAPPAAAAPAPAPTAAPAPAAPAPPASAAPAAPAPPAPAAPAPAAPAPPAAAPAPAAPAPATPAAEAPAEGAKKPLPF